MRLSPQTFVLFAHAGMGLAIVTAATVLGALHDLDAQAVVAIYGAAIGLVGGSAAALGSLAGAVNGKAVVETATLSNAIDKLAASSPTVTAPASTSSPVVPAP